MRILNQLQLLRLLHSTVVAASRGAVFIFLLVLVLVFIFAAVVSVIIICEREGATTDADADVAVREEREVVGLRGGAELARHEAQRREEQQAVALAERGVGLEHGELRCDGAQELL